MLSRLTKPYFLVILTAFYISRVLLFKARIQITRTLTINFKIPNSILITKISHVKRIGVHIKIKSTLSKARPQSCSVPTRRQWSVKIKLEEFRKRVRTSNTIWMVNLLLNKRNLLCFYSNKPVIFPFF